MSMEDVIGRARTELAAEQSAEREQAIFAAQEDRRIAAQQLTEQDLLDSAWCLEARDTRQAYTDSMLDEFDQHFPGMDVELVRNPTMFDHAEGTATGFGEIVLVDGIMYAHGQNTGYSAYHKWQEIILRELSPSMKLPSRWLLQFTGIKPPESEHIEAIQRRGPILISELHQFDLYRVKQLLQRLMSVPESKIADAVADLSRQGRHRPAEDEVQSLIGDDRSLLMNIDKSPSFASPKHTGAAPRQHHPLSTLGWWHIAFLNRPVDTVSPSAHQKPPAFWPVSNGVPTQEDTIKALKKLFETHPFSCVEDVSGQLTSRGLIIEIHSNHQKQQAKRRKEQRGGNQDTPEYGYSFAAGSIGGNSTG